MNLEEYELTLSKMKDSGLSKNIGQSSDSTTALAPEWVSVFEAPIGLSPHNHPQAYVNHVFLGYVAVQKGSYQLLVLGHVGKVVTSLFLQERRTQTNL